MALPRLVRGIVRATFRRTRRYRWLGHNKPGHDGVEGAAAFPVTLKTLAKVQQHRRPG
jgi:hypothetical protein